MELGSASLQAPLPLPPIRQTLPLGCGENKWMGFGYGGGHYLILERCDVPAGGSTPNASASHSSFLQFGKPFRISRVGEVQGAFGFIGELLPFS